MPARQNRRVPMPPAAPAALPRWPLGRWPAAAWPALGLGLAVAGTAALLAADLTARRAAFDTDARIAHRLLSQQAVQVDAMLAMLMLLQPLPGTGPELPGAAAPPGPAQRLPAIAPQVLQVLHRVGSGSWPADLAAALARAEAASAAAHRPVLADADLARGQYTVLRAGQPASWALRIDAAQTVPWAEWPLPREGPARAWLEHQGQAWLLQPGRGHALALPGPWRLEARKRLASDSQPLELVVALELTPAQLPWGALAAWCLLCAGLAWAGHAWQRQREGAQRSQALLRLGQVGRLNAMGELAAGMAHELNQPLTAVLASTQAAQRLLDELLAAQRAPSGNQAPRSLAQPLDGSAAGVAAEPADEPPSELVTARQALAHSAQQARRAADVVARLRRLVQPADPAVSPQPVALADAVGGVLYLLAPQTAQLGVQVDSSGLPAQLRVQADPVALEQILHNLVLNALQAMEQSPPGARRLHLRAEVGGATTAGVNPGAAGDAVPGVVHLHLRDSGPGFAAAALARAFEPFFTTRADGLGLGLSLCESLAASQGGSLRAANAAGGGAEITLTLPAAVPAPP